MSDLMITPGIKGSRGARTMLIGVLSVGFLGLGCGDDSGTTKKRPPRRSAARAAAPAAGAAAANVKGLKFYRKVEEVLKEVCERSKFMDSRSVQERNDRCQRWVAEQVLVMRHDFASSDFAADPTGGERRDPFRSYVVRQQGISDRDSPGPDIGKSERCTEKNMIAPNPMARDPRARAAYSLRDLRLVGIVLRGTNSYALFKDRANFGHIVRRGNCLGKEKAKVTKIGAGFVRLELIPESAAVGTTGDTATGRPIQKRSIKLYPEELPVDLAEGDGRDGGDTGVVRPPTVRPTAPPPPSRAKKGG